MDVHLPPGGPLSGMAADVRAGLTKPFKELSPRYFYDERGSELFERITELVEYYPTRCEREILETRSAEIVAAAKPRALIELGSGSAAKTRVLLDAMSEDGCLEAYAPVDISEEITRDTADRIASEYEGVTVLGHVCDFELDLERVPVEGPRVIAFLGGTIGNFQPAQRASFLRRIANLLDAEDRFLLGTDLVKDRGTLELAYDDPQGVTAAFNKNVLEVLNDRLQADFDVDAFEHVARWDADNLWMDIRLRSLQSPGDRHQRPRPPGRVRRRRGDAHRDLHQVHAPGPRGHLFRGRPGADRLVDRRRGPLRPQPRPSALATVRSHEQDLVPRPPSSAPAPRSARRPPRAW